MSVCVCVCNWLIETPSLQPGTKQKANANHTQHNRLIIKEEQGQEQEQEDDDDDEQEAEQEPLLFHSFCELFFVEILRQIIDT